jgi:hypothetical protein
MPVMKMHCRGGCRIILRGGFGVMWWPPQKMYTLVASAENVYP